MMMSTPAPAGLNLLGIGHVDLASSPTDILRWWVVDCLKDFIPQCLAAGRCGSEDS